ncbi:MAG: FkbM family methyltransferase [Burkholderiales bacterium]
MLNNLKKYLTSVLKNFVKHRLWPTYWRQESYSQEGEDLLVSRLLDGIKTGFYVDVGAHHPFRFSNTYIFYKRGWRGINIDARPGIMDMFKRKRPRDINLEIGVSAHPTAQEFFVFNEPALNTFVAKVAMERDGHDGYKIIDKVNVKCLPLSTILESYLLPEDYQFEFLSVDVEGLDLEVLKSNDWTRFRPKLIIAEALGANLIDIINAEMTSYLSSVGYSPYCKLGHSVIYLSDN